MKRKFLDTEMARYVILEPLAEGGMGVIYRGKKIGVAGSEKDVVVKQLLPEFTSQPEFIGLFLREAKLTASLEHVNIVRTLDLVASGSNYFIVMEYVEGADLRAVLRKIRRRRSRLEAPAALLITREVLSGLDYAHNCRDHSGHPLKVIHRDISPSNIMLSASGEAKLTDFGIAKVSTHKSVFYRVKGKAGYMSPEQAFGDRPIDGRSDLYSVGVCLYEALTGERLFIADLLSSPGQIYNQPVPKLEGTLDVPRGTDAVLQRALAVDTESRYQNALDFQEDLLQLAYDSGQLYTARELATHLRDQCGDNPARWRVDDDEEAEQPPTEVFTAEGSMFSGVELTSVLDRPEVLSEGDEDSPGREIPTEQLEFSASGWVTRSVAQDMLRHDAPSTPSARLEPSATSPVNPTPPATLDLDNATTAAYDAQSWPQPDARETGSTAITAESASQATVQDPPLHQMTTHMQPPRPAARPGTTPPTGSAPGIPASLSHVRADGNTRAAAVALERRERRIIVVAAILLFASAGILLALAMLEFGGDAQPTAPLTPLNRLRVGETATGDASSGPARDASVKAEAVIASHRVKVTSRPETADVYLDDSKECATPCAVEVPRDRRVHVVGVRKRRYVSWSELVDSRGPPRSIKARLTSEPDPETVGFLVIRSTTNADVLVDGRAIGRVAAGGRIPLSPGRYAVQLRHPRIKKRPEFVVEIKAGQTAVQAVPF